MKQEESLLRNRLRAPKAAAIAGIIFSVLLIISLVLLLISVPTHLNDNRAWLTVNGDNLLLAFHLIPFAGIAFLWFIGVVRDHLGESEDQFFATVFLGSGLLFLGLLFIATAVMGSIVLLQRTQPDRLLGSGIVDFGIELARAMMYTYAIRMAGVFMISTSSLFIRTQVLPRWIALLGYALALVMIVRIGHINHLGWVMLFFPLWILLVSIYILIIQRRSKSGVTPRDL